MTLLEVIYFTAEYYSQKYSDEVFKMFAADLADLPETECIAAYSRYRRDAKNTRMPLPAKIRELVRPQDSIGADVQAREIAARICAAVPRYGYCNAGDAQKYIGPPGWEIVQRQGGWTYICENLGRNLNPGTFQAQVRDQIEGSIKYGTANIERKILVLPPREKRNDNIGLESAKDIFKLISGLEPEEPEPA